MSENTTDETGTTEEQAPVVYEKGSWQDHLNKSSVLLDRSVKAKKTAGNLLWTGAVTGINEWLPNSSTDVSGEAFYNEVKSILGASRKGDANKIKTVAVAVRSHGLDLSVYPNLSKAYGAAIHLTKTVAAQDAEDDAAEKAIESLVAPKTTGSVEGAAALLLSKGVDGAVVAILDALGANNEAAHRAFMRAVSTEIAARVQAAKPKPAPKAGPKAGATQATTGGATPKAVKAQPGKGKGKPVKKVAAPKAAAPVETDKGESQAEPVEAGGNTASDMFDALDVDESMHTEPTEAPAPVKKAAVRKPVRRPARSV
jgi:hypothetical protein